MEYIDVDSIAYSNYVEISTHDAKKFVELAEAKNVPYILRDRAKTGVIFFCFAENGIIYRIKAHNLETLEELSTALGFKLLKRINDRYEFLTQNLHFPGVTIEVLDELDNPESSISSRIISHKKYLSTPQKIIEALVQSGFTDFESFADAFALGFKTKDELLNAEKTGYKNAHDFEEGKERGFDSAKEYYEANERGFKSKILFDRAKAKGYTNFGDYRVGERGGFKDAQEFHQASAKGIFSKKDTSE